MLYFPYKIIDDSSYSTIQVKMKWKMSMSLCLINPFNIEATLVKCTRTGRFLKIT